MKTFLTIPTYFSPKAVVDTINSKYPFSNIEIRIDNNNFIVELTQIHFCNEQQTINYVKGSSDYMKYFLDIGGSGIYANKLYINDVDTSFERVSRYLGFVIDASIHNNYKIFLNDGNEIKGQILRNRVSNLDSSTPSYTDTTFDTVESTIKENFSFLMYCSTKDANTLNNDPTVEVKAVYNNFIFFIKKQITVADLGLSGTYTGPDSVATDSLEITVNPAIPFNSKLYIDGLKIPISFINSNTISLSSWMATTSPVKRPYHGGTHQLLISSPKTAYVLSYELPYASEGSTLYSPIGHTHTTSDIENFKLNASKDIDTHSTTITPCGVLDISNVTSHKNVVKLLSGGNELKGILTYQDDPPTIFWADMMPTAAVTLTLTIKTTDSQPILLDWGDGNSEWIQHNVATFHNYAAGGPYNMRIYTPSRITYINDSADHIYLYGAVDFARLENCQIVGLSRHKIQSMKNITAMSGITSLQCIINLFSLLDITGSVNLLTINAQYNPNLTVITGVSALGQAIGTHNIQVFSCALTAACIDAILAACVAGGQINGVLNYKNQTGGGHLDANRSAQGLADKNTLIARGWTVVIA